MRRTEIRYDHLHTGRYSFAIPIAEPFGMDKAAVHRNGPCDFSTTSSSSSLKFDLDKNAHDRRAYCTTEASTDPICTRLYPAKWCFEAWPFAVQQVMISGLTARKMHTCKMCSCCAVESMVQLRQIGSQLLIGQPCHFLVCADFGKGPSALVRSS